MSQSANSVNCRIGSLEMFFYAECLCYFVNCRIGSLETDAVISDDLASG